MKGKLIKTDVNYILEDDKGVVIASTSLKKEGLSLSLKNCQAIERGYDLDELAKIEYPICEVWNDEEALIRELAFKKGFKKALELLGDKKFSEEDIKKVVEISRQGSLQKTHNGYGVSTGSVFVLDKLSANDIIKSLQQTEWDVEIETVPALSNNGNVYYGEIPKLDVDGCLILKRI